jgi:hypothetical protein
MANATKTNTKKTPAPKKPTVGGATAKKSAAPRPAKKSAASAAAPQPPVRSPREVVDELRVQASLAGMDGRDYLDRLIAEVDQRRGRVEQAVDALVNGSGDAARTLADGVRDALDELRAAVALSLRTLR